MAARATKVYELYPGGRSGFSNQTADYQGEIVAVAAVSNRQAHYLAHANVWASDPDNPRGILWRYSRGAGAPGDHWLFTGARIYGLGGIGVIRRNAGKRAIGAWMREALAADELSVAGA